jgi:hypothetical protein
MKNNPQEMKKFREAHQPTRSAIESVIIKELNLSSKIITDSARTEEKSVFSYLRGSISNFIDRLRGKKASDVQHTREASASEISQVLFENSAPLSNAGLLPRTNQIHVAKISPEISGESPPVSPPPTTPAVDLYSDVGVPVKARSEERIREQKKSKPIVSPTAQFIINLKEEMSLWLFVDQERINEYMTSTKIQELNSFNKEELIAFANVHAELAYWLFNHAENTDDNYKNTLDNDGMQKINQLANIAVLQQRPTTTTEYQILIIDQVERFILDKNIVKDSDFVYPEQFPSILKNVLSKLSDEHKKAPRDAIFSALMKHNIKVGQKFAVVPPSDYRQKMDNFNASLKLFNNVIVVALHSLLEKLNFTNHYDQLIKIREELTKQCDEIENYRSALGANFSGEEIDNMALSAVEKEKREELLKDAQIKWDYINSEIKRIDNLRDGFNQGVQKKLQAVRTFLPKPPLELPTHTQADSSITVTPPKPMPHIKAQIYVKVKDKNEFRPLPKEQQNTLIMEMHFKIDKNGVTSHVPRKPYDEAALRALAKEMMQKAREAYGKDTPLKIDGKGKLLEYAQTEYQKLRELYAEQPALRREHSVRMSPRPKSTPPS